jgi:hypothetical protein
MRGPAWVIKKEQSHSCTEMIFLSTMGSDDVGRAGRSVMQKANQSPVVLGSEYDWWCSLVVRLCVFQL